MDPANELSSLAFLAPDLEASALIQMLRAETNENTLVSDAIEIACTAHAAQHRDEGVPYIVHPLRVAYSLSTLDTSPTMLAAALLHDVIEDAPRYTRLVYSLHEEVAWLVEVLTEYWDEDYYGKILIAGQDAARVKTADRIDNLRFLHRTEQPKQVRYLRETVRVFPPIVHAAQSVELTNALGSLLTWHSDRIYQKDEELEMPS